MQTVTLADFTQRLERDIPPVGDYPSPVQYEDAARDAVAAYNEIVGRKQVYTFTTTPRQATYSLPPDYSRLIYLEELVPSDQVGGVLVSAAGLVPLPMGGLRETVMVAGHELMISPSPEYALQRRVWYRAIHALDADDSYPHMTDDEFRAIYVKATANVWRLICGRVSRSESWKYTHGDTTVDKTNVAKSLQTWVSALDSEFSERAGRIRGAGFVIG